MAKKLSLQIDYFEGYHLLGVVSNLKDYTLTFHVNKLLGLDLKKYDDLKPIPEGKQEYPWFCHWRKEDPVSYYLVGNYHPLGILIPSQKNFDFFILIKNGSEQKILEIASRLRTIDKVNGVFQLEMGKIKDMNIIMEILELHEFEQVIRPKRNK